MASRRNDDGQLLLLAGVLLVISYVLFSSQASLIATLGQQSGREASNPVVIDYAALRETIQVTLTREHTEGWDPALGPSCDDADEAEMTESAKALLRNIAVVESRRGMRFLGTVGTVEIVDNTDARYPLTLTLTNGETTIAETATFVVDCT